MTKYDYIQNNKYLRMGLSKLCDSDIQFFNGIVTGNIDPHSKDTEIYFRQLLFRMTSNMSIREIRGFYKAFKTLSTLEN